MNIEISSLYQLEMFAKKLAKNLSGGEVLALNGELGAGKTAFAKKLLSAAGIKKSITSPTFVLMIPYKSKDYTFYHMDLYRINGYKEVKALGVEELWERDENIFIIEWAAKIKRHLPKNTIFLNFKLDKLTRKIEIKNASKKLTKVIAA